MTRPVGLVGGATEICVTWTTAPATATVVLRSLPVRFRVKLIVSVPLPFPLTGFKVSQLAEVDADHVQLAELAVTVTATDFAAAAALMLRGDTVTVQDCADWLTATV